VKYAPDLKPGFLLALFDNNQRPVQKYQSGCLPWIGLPEDLQKIQTGADWQLDIIGQAAHQQGKYSVHDYRNRQKDNAYGQGDAKKRCQHSPCVDMPFHFLTVTAVAL
jgi:hypothetical protein